MLAMLNHGIESMWKEALGFLTKEFWWYFKSSQGLRFRGVCPPSQTLKETPDYPLFLTRQGRRWDSVLKPDTEHRCWVYTGETLLINFLLIVALWCRFVNCGHLFFLRILIQATRYQQVWKSCYVLLMVCNPLQGFCFQREWTNGDTVVFHWRWVLYVDRKSIVWFGGLWSKRIIYVYIYLQKPLQWQVSLN